MGDRRTCLGATLLYGLAVPIVSSRPLLGAGLMLPSSYIFWGLTGVYLTKRRPNRRLALSMILVPVLTLPLLGYLGYGKTVLALNFFPGLMVAARACFGDFE